MIDHSIISSAWFALGSSLVSGALAVVVSIFYYRHQEKRKAKLDCLRRLLGARYVLTEGKHSQGAEESFFMALNEAVVIYSDAPTVVAALKKLLDDMPRSERLHDNVVTLFKAMVDHLGLDRGTLNDSFFLQAFRPNPRRPGA